MKLSSNQVLELSNAEYSSAHLPGTVKDGKH